MFEKLRNQHMINKLNDALYFAKSVAEDARLKCRISILSLHSLSQRISRLPFLLTFEVFVIGSGNF